ncbi:DNA-directed RNA polymerase subunit L [Candidatus Woesearchaeota archaeon]|nr:DNA-directed RNA polymerase subunit L [Candidatus Woesearchaeota archaeon]
MEIKVIEDKKNRIIIEFGDRDHTFCNVLKNELVNDSHVKIAGYNVKHPLVGKPQIIVETDGADPRRALTDAAERLKKLVERFEKEFVKEVK